MAMEGMANGIAMKFMAGVSGMIIKIAVGAVEGRTSKGGTGRATNSHGNGRESCRKKIRARVINLLCIPCRKRYVG